MHHEKQFGRLIDRLIQKQNLTRRAARNAFIRVLTNGTTPMQQGAFLAALHAKGETEQEIAGAWEAIYEQDTIKVKMDANAPLVDNSGTGMDTFKTFNISTAAAIVAASIGVRMARHGARAITSVCGTVDMAEALGVDVDCTADLVAQSIKTANIGLFNGMSPKIHPMALGRILSQIHFGTTLNIAASLANPAMPRYGVRGVYAKEMIMPVIRVMQAIGYQRAMVCHGEVAGTDCGMDEASVCGTTWCAELNENGEIHTFTLEPDQLGLNVRDPDALRPDGDKEKESRRFVALMRGRENGNSARRQAILLNTALILKLTGRTDTIPSGMHAAAEAIDGGDAWRTLAAWVAAQNRHSDQGLERLHRLRK